MLCLLACRQGGRLCQWHHVLCVSACRAVVFTWVAMCLLCRWGGRLCQCTMCCLSVTPCAVCHWHSVLFQPLVLYISAHRQGGKFVSDTMCCWVSASGQGGRVCEGHVCQRAEQGWPEHCGSAGLPGESARYKVLLVCLLRHLLDTVNPLPWLSTQSPHFGMLEPCFPLNWKKNWSKETVMTFCYLSL